VAAALVATVLLLLFCDVRAFFVRFPTLPVFIRLASIPAQSSEFPPGVSVQSMSSKAQWAEILLRAGSGKAAP
jgi:hypothetical protein